MSEQNQNDEPVMLAKAPRFSFTIGSMLILMTVIAASGTSLGYYVKALRAEDPTTEVGTFAIVASMTPTVFLVVASWFLKSVSFFGKILK